MPCAAHRLACVLHAVGRDVECLEAESQSALWLWSGVCRAAGGGDSRHNTQTRKEKKKTWTSLKCTNWSFESSRRKRSAGSSGGLLTWTRRVCGLHGHGRPLRKTPRGIGKRWGGRRRTGGGAFGDERRVKLWNAPQWAIMNFKGQFFWTQQEERLQLTSASCTVFLPKACIC